MTAVCIEQRSPAEARWRGDHGRGGAVTWRYDVCQGPVTLAEFDQDCRMVRWFVRGVGVAEGIGDVVAEVDVSGESPKPHYYLYNHRGDVLVVLNPDGAANSTFRYDAFGNYYQMTGPFTPRYTFSTKEYLPAAGLYLYQYRVYDPIAGRWTQRDPIDYQDSINLYQFCGNNPVNATDPDGRFLLVLAVAVVVVVVVGVVVVTCVGADEAGKAFARDVNEGNTTQAVENYEKNMNAVVGIAETGVDLVGGVRAASKATAGVVAGSVKAVVGAGVAGPARKLAAKGGAALGQTLANTNPTPEDSGPTFSAQYETNGNNAPRKVTYQRE